LPAEFSRPSIDLHLRFEYVPEKASNGLQGRDTERHSTGHFVHCAAIVFRRDPASGSIKYSGTATLQLVVTTEGKAENIKILKSLGPGLDQQALDAAGEWKFEPAMKDPKPVTAEIALR
jgi:TonB family protein